MAKKTFNKNEKELHTGKQSNMRANNGGDNGRWALSGDLWGRLTPWISICVFAILAWIMLVVKNSDYLYLVQERSLFSDTEVFFNERMAVPSGLIQWIGCYLTQLFYYPMLGSSVLIGIWVITFFAMKAIPGGPFLSEKAATPAVTAQLEAKYGLDKPLMEQYFTYLKDIFTKFDFGPSLKLRGRNVIDIIGDGMKVSAKLGLLAASVALVIGVVLGAVAALRRNKFIDKVIMVMTTAFISMPSFIMGTLMLLVFALQLSLVPANGETAQGLILPVITLSLSPMANITRLTRSSMLDVLGQDYIRTARAKGVSQIKIIFGHALKNALIPVITYFGPMLAYIVTGSLVVEQIFAVPGIGRYFVSSITGRDYPLIMGTTIVLASLIVIMNLISDIMYKIVDPRITLE